MRCKAFDTDIERKLAELQSRSRLRTVKRPQLHVGAVDLANNDYLGLAHDKSLLEAFDDETRGLYRAGASSSALLMHAEDAHSELTALIEQSVRMQCVLFPSGWHANTGLIGALAQFFAKDLLIVADRLVHASTMDGLRIATTYGCHIKRFAHNSQEALANILKNDASRFRAVLLCVESLYSMDGDLADLACIVKTCRSYENVLLALDEAHSWGVYGAGAGFAAETGLLSDIDFFVGTFGKALAGHGAFIATDAGWGSLLANLSRPLIYSTALSPKSAAWIAFLLKRSASFENRRKRLFTIAGTVNNVVLNHPDRVNFADVPQSASYISTLICGTDEKAQQANAKLLQKGFAAALVRPPTVPEGTARLRISLSASLNDHDVERLCAVLQTIDG